MADISTVKIGTTSYDIKAKKTVGALSIGGKSFDGSAAVSVTSSDLGIETYTAGEGISILGTTISAPDIATIKSRLTQLESVRNQNTISYPV